MARKKYGKHSKTPAATSATARRSHVALGAATAVVGASLALGVTPAFAQTGAAAAPAQPAGSAAQSGANNNQKPADNKKDAGKPADKKQVETKDNKKQNAKSEKTELGVSSTKPAAGNKDAGSNAAGNGSVTQSAPKAVQGTDKGANDPAPAPTEKPQANSTIELSKDKKDTLPNMYAWGKSDNVYVESGQNQAVTFKFAKPSDGSTITKVAIFPSDGNTVDNAKSRRFLEYYSDAAAVNEHQPYSGTYEFKVDTDGTATLTMTKLYRNGNLKSGESYSANRCIYVYGTDKNGNTVVLYKTNIVRAATLIPPKKAGSIVLKYNEELTDEQIRAKLKQALDAPTEATGNKSIREQIKAASTANGVGVRDKVNEKKLDTTPDDPEKKVVITDQRAYLPTELARINTVTSKPDAKEKTYVTGVNNLKTRLVSDLGYQSEPLALTVARYDTRIDKPTVEDPTNVSQDVKNEIIKKLASLNHVGQDKVSISDKGEVTINFDGVDEKDAPKIALRDLVLKKFEEKDISVPAADKAVFVANPLAYSDAEIKSIKKAIYEANKDNQELGLSADDYEKQITLSYLTGNLTATGDSNKGISNGQQENKITVKIKTDKAVAEFKSDVKTSKLTKLPDIRKDYTVSWTNNKIDGRDTDEGLSWSEDKKTIIYRYDPTKAQEFDTTKILGLLKATPNDKQAGLRELTGGEALGHEGADGKAKKSHVGYVLNGDEPTTELSLGNMSGAYWKYEQNVSNSGVNLGDAEADAGSYSWDNDAKPVVVAGKKGKIYKARLFVLPYAMTHYKHVYLEQGAQPWNTTKAINVIFVPQTNHKTKDLSDSIGEHKLADDKKTPTEAKYYNASADKKEAYEKALDDAKKLYDSVKDTDESKLTEDQKAQIDNATIQLDKARKALDGADTNKDGLDKSITEDGTPAEGQQATTGTKASDRYKNVTEPDFKKADGSDDTERNEAAKKAKTAYDEALAEANKVKEDKNATQKAVDDAKAKLDAAREKLNDFTTNKDELNNAIAQHGKVNTGRDAQGTQDVTKADPTYQNSSKQEQKAYDDAVAEADKVSKDPNASQKEVNDAIKKLKDAKDALDKNATDKAPLDAAVQKSFDNPDPTKPDKQSVFYKNAAAKKDTDPDAKKAVEDYDKALQKAKDVLADKNATKKDVDDAKKALEKAEEALHADKYQTKATDLAEAIADNFSGYLMPAYFNAFDKAQAEGKDSQAAKDFKAYNDAYHAAKDLMENLKKSGSTIEQKDVDKVKDQLIAARKIIDTYATDTSRLSAAVFNDIAIKNSPAYKNLKALAEKTNPTPEEQADVEAAKKAMEAYKKATDKLHNAITNKLPRDKANDQDIPDTNIPDKNGNLNDKDYLKDIQAHKNGEPLDRDVDAILKEMNAAAAELNKFATKTDELLKSVNEDAATHQNPAFKNASHPDYKNESGQADTDKNGKASKAVDDYGKALNEAKELLKNPAATQKEVNDALKKLDDARKELDKYNTDTAKLVESVKKHGDTEGTAPTEGTQTSDAYRNASDPHFMKEEGGKLVPDTDKNAKAAAAKKAYDEALTKAQELLKKHDDDATPQDAKPTQKDINAALKALDDARTEIEKYKTVTTELEAEANKSTPEHAAVTENDFENTPEFKNAKAKTSDGQTNADVAAYQEALKKARDLAKAAADQDKKNSERPTQKQINEALDALKAAKKQITDNYKTNLEALTAAKDFADGDFKKTPEYKNALAKKTAGDQGATAALGTDGGDTGFDNVLNQIKQKLNDDNWKKTATQKSVNNLLKKLQEAQEKIAKEYKTDVKPLQNEVGDKDEHGKDVTPPFEASVPYKNALEKAKTETGADAEADTSATKKLKAYADKLKAAQELINKVNNLDPNAKPEDRPTQKQVDDALAALKQAKKDIDDAFKTKADALKKETKELKDDGQPKEEKDKFEKSTEYQNALDKTDADSKKDVQTYKAALEKANKLLELFGDDGNLKADIPAGTQIPTQQEVDEARKALKEIKDKILANYKTSPVDLQKEVDLSKDGDDDKRDDVFENTPAFKNATDKGDEAAKQALDDYSRKLKAAKDMLDKFDRTTGKPRTDLPAGTKVPTQKEMDDALKALQDAKAKIEKDYATQKQNLQTDYDNRSKEHTSDYSMASKDKQEKYSKMLDEANKVLQDPNATQAEVDAAQAKLKGALEELEKSANANRRALYEDMVIDARNALQKLVDANEATHLKDLYTHAEPAAQHEFMAAMDNAKKVLADKEALASELDAARVRLLRALDGLAAHQLPGMTNAGANGANVNAGAAGANGAAGYGAHAAGAYGRGAHAAGRVRAHAGKHLAQTSDPTNALAAAGMLASALGFIAMGFKTKKRRAK